MLALRRPPRPLGLEPPERVTAVTLRAESIQRSAVSPSVTMMFRHELA